VVPLFFPKIGGFITYPRSTTENDRGYVINPPILGKKRGTTKALDLLNKLEKTLCSKDPHRAYQKKREDST
jgi:hypothetical protein